MFTGGVSSVTEIEGENVFSKPVIPPKWSHPTNKGQLKACSVSKNAIPQRRFDNYDYQVQANQLGTLFAEAALAAKDNPSAVLTLDDSKPLRPRPSNPNTRNSFPLWSYSARNHVETHSDDGLLSDIHKIWHGDVPYQSCISRDELNSVVLKKCNQICL
jgi:hypothetical protein